MPSPRFLARTTHSTDDPQICGLTDATGCCHSVQLEADSPPEEVPGAIVEDQECFYLTCRGDQAKPSLQIEGSNKKDSYSTGYRSVPSGRKRIVGKCRAGHKTEKECDDAACTKGRWYRKPIFKWQEMSADGRWHDVEVWEKMVHVECANKAGYRIPAAKTVAHRGARPVGYAHKVKPEAISALEELALADFGEDG